MKILSMIEFKNYCNERSLHNFILTSENQKNDMTQYTIKARLSFSKMTISLIPNMICFENGDNYVMFDGVRCVRIVDEESPIGVIFDVVCEGLYSNEEIVHTILAK